MTGPMLEWYGSEVARSVESVLSRRVQAAADDLAESIRSVLDEPALRTRPSLRPRDEPPRRRTGRLRSSISVFGDAALTRAVGTDRDYGAFLETGTSRQTPHRYLTRVLEQSLDRIRDRIAARIE